MAEGRSLVVGMMIVLVGAAVPSQATHEEGYYEAPVWFEWGQLDLDVLILPPGPGPVRTEDGLLDGPDPAQATPCDNAYVRALRDAVENWRAAVQAEAAAWLADGLDLRTHVFGCDAPEDLPTDPEIVAETDGTKYPLFIAAATGGDPCVITNSRIGKVAEASYADMLNVFEHEFGHCLGHAHTGDPDGGSAGEAGHPTHDAMEGGYEHLFGASGTHRHCISTLNVRVLEAVFDDVADPGAVVRVPVDAYEWIQTPYCTTGQEPFV